MGRLPKWKGRAALEPARRPDHEARGRDGGASRPRLVRYFSVQMLVWLASGPVCTGTAGPLAIAPMSAGFSFWT